MNAATKYLPARGDRRRHYIPAKPMKNMTIDLEQEIVAYNTVTLATENKVMAEQKKFDVEAAKVESAVAEAYRIGIMAELGFDYELAEARRIRHEQREFSALAQNRIMSTAAIKAVCLKYSLRFLPTRFYKGALDQGIGPAVEKTKAALGTLPTFKSELLNGYENAIGATEGKPCFAIAAPSEAFALQPRPVDPLLFLRLNDIKWFLVHKWGNDLQTADIRKGEIGEHNWNSSFSDRPSGRDATIRAMLGSQSIQLTTTSTPNWVANSQSPWNVSGTSTDANGIGWASSIVASPFAGNPFNTFR